MLTELWLNKAHIFKNYTNILYSNRFGLSVIAVLFGLIIIYAYMRYQEFSLHWQLLNHDPHGTDGPADSVLANDMPYYSAFIEEAFENSQPEPRTKYDFSFILPGSPESKSLYSMCYQNYLTGFNQPNIQARGFDTKAELERTYKTMIIPITSSEQTHISSTLSNILSQIPETKLEKVSSWIGQASIAKGAKWLESGMPHTHGNTMIMNTGWISNPTCTTYFHELFHIIQRNNPSIFEILYTQSWHFKKVAGGAKSILGLESQILLSRMNPDANDFCWVWLDNTTGKYYWFNAVFTQSAPSSLLAVQYLAYPLTQQQDGRTFRYLGSQPIELKSLISFVNMFGIGYNHYHPNEIASQYAEYYFVENSSQIQQEIKNKPAYIAFTNWLDNLVTL